MSGHHLMYTLALLLTSTTVSVAVQTLDSINDLKKIEFGVSVPKHSLLLLHWFANAIEIDNNDVIHLTFDPNRGDYGAHHYANIERLLGPLLRGYRYYTIGNLNPELSSSVRLPNYVTRSPRHLMGDEETNRDRIIVRVREYNRSYRIIDQVYITQHYGLDWEQGTSYDPQHTYRISNDLLRDIRLFSTTTAVGNQRRSLREIRDHFGSHVADSQIRDLENVSGELACAWLLLFIVIAERQRRCPARPRRERNEATPAESGVDIPDDVQYEWETGRQNTCSHGTCLPECIDPETKECKRCIIVAILIAIVIVVVLSLLVHHKLTA